MSVTISVNIDLDDIETKDLVSEIIRRTNPKIKYDPLTADHKLRLTEAMNSRIHIPIQAPEIQTLDDVMKYEHLAKVFTKYSYSSIERALPEC